MHFIAGKMKSKQKTKTKKKLKDECASSFIDNGQLVICIFSMTELYFWTCVNKCVLCGLVDFAVYARLALNFILFYFFYIVFKPLSV